MRYISELQVRLHGNALIVAMLVLLLLVRVVGSTGFDREDVPGLTTDRACNVPVVASSSSSSRRSWCAPDVLPFPFARSVECAVSPDFVVENYCAASSNGSQQAALWDNFTHAMPQQDVQQGRLVRPPVVLGMGLSTDEINNIVTLVNLTWDSEQLKAPRSSCSQPHTLFDLSHSFPASINLSSLRPSNIYNRYKSGFGYIQSTSLVFSSNNVFLFFNCTNSTGEDYYGRNSYWQARRSSTLCGQYVDETCKQNLTEWFDETPNCYELQYGMEGIKVLPYQLSLQEIMLEMMCTHFEVFVASSELGSKNFLAVSQWRPGLVQLQWQDVSCQGCQDSGGECVYARNRSYYGCKCSQHGRSHIFSEDCYPSEYCWEVGAISICNVVAQAILIIGGISIGCLLFLVGVCCCAYRCGKRSMKNRRLKRRALWERQHSVNGANVDSMVSELVDLRGLSERPMEFSYKSIESATNSFSSLVGKGGFGVVFKGALAASRNKGNDQEQYASTCKEIAVKVLDVRSHHSKKQFLNEVAIIGRVHHINVVRLLGFCVHDEHEMLVYEYVSNGSLDQWLFDRQNSRDNMTMMLDWRQRYSIAVGIARGLSYLHEECRHRIVHCDVKPQNILLDGQMCPKIADFGLARLINRGESRVVTFAKGTPGYMAPELWVGGDIQLTTKADVYSFGMVLLELISGRPNFALGLPHFPAVASDTVINKGNLDSLLDARLTSAVHSESEQNVANITQQQQIRTAVFVALWCVQERPANRPCMSAVVQFLEGVAAVSEHLPASASAGSVQLEGQHIYSFALSSTSDLAPR